jgi:hypothetical protein
MASELPRGHRVLPAIIDDYAKVAPDKIYAVIPVNDDDLSQGFKNITYEQFANAVNAASWWLESTLGQSSSFETFAYYGLRDLRYTILVIAAAKVQRKVTRYS